MKFTIESVTLNGLTIDFGDDRQAAVKLFESIAGKPAEPARPAPPAKPAEPAEPAAPKKRGRNDRLYDGPPIPLHPRHDRTCSQCTMTGTYDLNGQPRCMKHHPLYKAWRRDRSKQRASEGVSPGANVGPVPIAANAGGG